MICKPVLKIENKKDTFGRAGSTKILQDERRGNVLSVTHAARAHLAQVLEYEVFPPEYVVRIAIEGKSVKLSLGEEKPEDVSYRYQEKTVLVFDKEMANQLEDLTLDVDLSAAKPRLVFK